MTTDYRTSGYLSAVHKRDAQTIRNWCDTYAEFLSPTGKGTRPGATRKFNVEDQFVIATIAELSDMGLTTETIKGRLNDGYRVEQLPEPPTEEEERIRQNISLVPASDWLRVMDQVKLLQEEIRGVSEERDQALIALDEANKSVANLRHQIGLLEGRLQEIDRRDNRSDTQADALQQEIIRLNREVARLELMLEMERNKKGQDK